MPKLNSTVKSVRLDNDILAELEKRLGGKTYNAWLNEKIAEELGKPNKNIETVRVNPVNAVINTSLDAFVDLKSIVDYYGITMDGLLEKVDVALNDGTLSLDDGKLVCVLPDWAVKLSDACHEIGYDVDKIVDSAIKSLKKGSL